MYLFLFRLLMVVFSLNSYKVTCTLTTISFTLVFTQGKYLRAEGNKKEECGVMKGGEKVQTEKDK